MTKAISNEVQTNREERFRTEGVPQKEQMLFHHVCIIGSDYAQSLNFYENQLGMTVHRESFSVNRNARKIELYYDDTYMIELFIPLESEELILTEEGQRSGLDHVSFLVPSVERKLYDLNLKGVPVSEVKKDEGTGKAYGFCYDPDGQKIEFYQI